MIYVGTSGFKFDDWKGRFYPDEVKEKDWLHYYGERFSCLEVNASYYRLMHPATFFHMANKVPEEFEFTVKAYRTLTHEIGSDNEADFAAFLESIGPLVEANKFGCLLAQFPNSFHNTPGGRDYLARLCDRFSGSTIATLSRYSPGGVSARRVTTSLSDTSSPGPHTVVGRSGYTSCSATLRPCESVSVHRKAYDA